MPDEEDEIDKATKTNKSVNSNKSNKSNKSADLDQDLYAAVMSGQLKTDHPERYVLGKPSPNRARQFKPFAALRGYEELIQEVIAQADEPHDFSELEESC